MHWIYYTQCQICTFFFAKHQITYVTPKRFYEIWMHCEVIHYS
jgi:hypothetical protein